MEALLWALRLAVLGKSRPVPMGEIRAIKQWWFAKATGQEDHDRHTAIMTTRWEALQSSGTDLAQKAGVVLAIFAFGLVPWQVLAQNRHGNHALAWVALALLGVSILLILIMLTPKFKVWRRHDWDNEITGLMFDPDGLEHYLWLVRKCHHRKQLIAFERRTKNLAVVIALIAFGIGGLAML